ncbi:MAG: hypothetical protein Q8S73_13795 [Deltaproteobacteria bacterium]|nr:hypothetical protein [Myxococcales bacterium]MDP3215174.1 hypothetical protein [Deltaproteobacteria bacterium]
MTKMWMVGWMLALGGCSSAVIGGGATGADVPASDVGATAVDVRGAREDAARSDGGTLADVEATGVDASAADVPVVEDVPPRRDTPTPWEPPPRTGPISFVVVRSGGNCIDFFPHEDSTVYEDGRVDSFGYYSSGSPYEDRRWLPAGVDSVRSARLTLEASGLLDVPEGTYHIPQDRCESVSLEYHRAGRVYSWLLETSTDDPLPPPSLVAAIAVAEAYVRSAR